MKNELLLAFTVAAATACAKDPKVTRDPTEVDAGTSNPAPHDRGTSQDAGMNTPDMSSPTPDAGHIVPDAAPVHQECADTIVKVAACLNDCDENFVPQEGQTVSDCYIKCEAFKIADRTIDCCAEREDCYDAADGKSGYICQNIFPANSATCCAEENAICSGPYHNSHPDYQAQCREDWDVPNQCIPQM